MKRSSHITVAILVVLLIPLAGQAQIPDPVSFSFEKSSQHIKAGSSFDLVLKAAIKGKWHLYSVNNDPDAGPYPTQFSAGDDQIKLTGSVKESDPIREFDPNFKAELGWHEDEATFTIPVVFKESASGATTADIKVRYQVCTNKVCLPPKTKHLTTTVNVKKGKGKAKVKANAGNISDGTDAGNVTKPEVNDTKEESNAKAMADRGNEADGSAAEHINTPESTITPSKTATVGGKGLFSFIWIALTAGFAALITPCVYPMIPLTVSYFSKKEEASNRNQSGVVSAFGFGLAIILIFTVLGILLSLFIGVAGANQFAANPWVNLFIAAVLVIFAFSLLGAFEIRLPYRLTNWLNRESHEQSGVLGTLFIALTISAVSFSCTAPFVGGVLAATAGGQWFYPIIGMICFSAAFATPFVILALFPGWLDGLPQSGAWMNVIKVILGFIELAAAFKFLSNADLVWGWGLVSRPFVIAAWIAIFLLTGLYLLGVFSLHDQTENRRTGTGRVLLSIPFLLFSFYLIPGLMGASMGIWDAWLPPKNATDVSVVSSISQRHTQGEATKESSRWSGDYDAAIAEAQQADQPIFIDFTGYTCTNCRAMEANVFPAASVRQNLNKMTLVRLYTDDGTDGPANQKFQFKLTGTVALPTYVILNPHTQEIVRQVEGYTGKEKFEAFLKRGLAHFKKQKSSI